VLARVEGQQRLDVFRAKGFPANASIASLISKTVLQRILDQRQAVIIGDTAAVEGDVGGESSVIQNSIRAVACTPITDRRGGLTGLLYVDHQSRHAEFTTHDAEFLIWLGQVYDLLAEDMEMRRRLEVEVVTLKRAAGEARIIAEASVMVQLLERAKKAAASEAVLMAIDSGRGVFLFPVRKSGRARAARTPASEAAARAVSRMSAGERVRSPRDKNPAPRGEKTERDWTRSRRLKGKMRSLVPASAAMMRRAFGGSPCLKKPGEVARKTRRLIRERIRRA
jgi:hypothetical protein